MGVLLIIAVIAAIIYHIFEAIRTKIFLYKHPVNFQNKLIWITGASSGIGQALAISLSYLGANLIISSRNEASLQNVKKQCNSKAEVTILVLDLGNPQESNQKVIHHLTELEKQGKFVNIFINNAGASQRSLFVDFDYQNHIYMMNLNYNSPFLLSQTVAKHMLKNQQRNERNQAQIVVVCSMASKLQPGFRCSYSASKTAVSALFESFRLETNLKINLVYPGYVKSEGSKNALLSQKGIICGVVDDDSKDGMELVLINCSKYFIEQIHFGILKSNLFTKK